MEQKKGISLKIALLSTCFVTASINAITANIPEMTKSFPDVPLYVIELLTTVPSLFQMLGVLCGGLIAKRLGYKGTLLLGGLARGLGLVLAGAFALGYGYLGFVPFIQEQVSRDFAAYGETATNLILILQSLGAFAAPYLGNLFRLISESLRTQFFLCAGCCAALALFAALMQENSKAAVST